MARKKPGEAPKPMGRPRKTATPKRGRPRKAEATTSGTASTDNTIVGTPIQTSSAPATGSRAYQVAMSKISRAESFWGVGKGRPDRTMWADVTSPAETDQAFRERLERGRSNPEPVTKTTARALGERGYRGGEAGIAPIRDRPSPSLVGPGVPSLQGTHRAVPLGDRNTHIDTSDASYHEDFGQPAEGPYFPKTPKGPLAAVHGMSDHYGDKRLYTQPLAVAPAVPPTLVTFPGPVSVSAAVPAHMVSSQFRPVGTQVTGPRQTQGPRLFRSSRVQPQQARQEDADVYERLVHLHDSIRQMMEDSGAPEYRAPNTPPPPQASGLTELRGRVGDATMKTWIDEDIKKKWEEDNAKPEVEINEATGLPQHLIDNPPDAPVSTPRTSVSELIEKREFPADRERMDRAGEDYRARKAAEADMAAMDRENRNKKKK